MKKMISNIVFSKNRPLQLEAYLQSLYRYFPTELIQTYIIYKVELFSEEYESLFQRYSNCQVIEERDFHSDFLKVINQIDTKYILFGIDDVVFFDSVDFNVVEECFSKFGADIFGFSLRFGTAVIEDGNDPIHETVIAEQSVYSLNWSNGRTPNTCYPFELCATIYQTALIKRIIGDVSNNNPIVKKLFSPDSVLIKVLGKIISTRSILKTFGYFYNPNTLESWSCRWCQNHSQQLPKFLYFQKLCASAIQVNVVNTSTKNDFDSAAKYTVVALNEEYKAGYRLDIEFISTNKPMEPHSGKKYFRLVKSDRKVRIEKP